MSDYDVAATADCPAMNFALNGIEEDNTTALDALDAAVKTWSEGYNMDVDLIAAADYFASMATDTTLMVALGDELSLTEGLNGAYLVAIAWSWDDTTNATTTADAAAYYLPAADIAADAGVDGTADGIIDLSDETKYDYTTTAFAQSDDDIIADTEWTHNFYMPVESDADGETTATGDRINSGDKLGVVSGDNSSPVAAATCAEAFKIKLGAATLAAGVTTVSAILALF